ncbi:hypothetical protein DPMN_135329 [Dreissena polymorpha]|uniref:Uncharacterized protein n=1 Tax=Dreissena polymorpha TaxID=45954 RepID=A0A9D4G1M7_DREPO|nr:hypothetical protein DPMN_135329 [Dreissena polymorpha]
MLLGPLDGHSAKKAYGIEVSTLKSKNTVHITTNNSAGITMNVEKMEDATNFKYFRATLFNYCTSNA